MASATTARSRPSAGGFDPFKPVFRLLTSVRFAIAQLGLVALAALLGVVFPQVSDPVRLNPAAYDAWLELQRDRYGPFTDLMRRADLFEVFRSVWFNGLLILLLVSVGVCTANRFAPIWRSIRRPLRRVNDRYFDTAHARAAFPTPADPGGPRPADVAPGPGGEVLEVALGGKLGHPSLPTEARARSNPRWRRPRKTCRPTAIRCAP